MRKEQVLTFRELKKTVDKCDELIPEKLKDKPVLVVTDGGKKWTNATGARMGLVTEGKEIVYAVFDVFIDKNPR